MSPVICRPLRPDWCTLGAMNASFPTESEFATAEETVAYDRWFRARVQEAIDDSRPSIPHDHVMSKMRAIIATKRENRLKSQP